MDETFFVLGKILDSCTLCLSLNIVSTKHNQSQSKCHASVQWALQLCNCWQALGAYVCVAFLWSSSITLGNEKQIMIAGVLNITDINMMKSGCLSERCKGSNVSKHKQLQNITVLLVIVTQRFLGEERGRDAFGLLEHCSQWDSKERIAAVYRERRGKFTLISTLCMYAYFPCTKLFLNQSI